MKILTLLLLVVLCSAANAQTPLQAGSPLERELQPGQQHEFTVELQENNFIQLVVEQRGIDVIVKVSSPAGKSLGEFDTPNGAEGPEHVSFVAVAAGSYRVLVGPLDPKNTTTGKYEIRIFEVRKATDQELKTSRNLEATKAKGVALLADVEAMIPQIKSAQTRLKVQLQAGQLLWDIDQKRASNLFADAATTMKEYIESIHPDDLHTFQHTIGQLRLELVQALALRDPEAALSLLQSTSQTVGSAFDKRDHIKQESTLELAIADQIMRKDTKRALQMARQNLKRGYSSNLMNTLSQLRRQDPELGAELANEITAKVINEKLLTNTDAAYLAASLVRYIPYANPEPADKGAPRPSFLPEDRVKELIQKVFDEAVSYTQPAGQSYDMARDTAWNMLHALKSISAQLDTINPGANAAVDKKLAEFEASRPGVTLSGKSEGELSLEAIGKMPAGVREQLYLQFASNESQKGNLTRARQIVTENVTNPWQRRQALMQIDQQEMYQAMNQGKIDQLLRIISGFRSPRERAQQLSQVANNIGPGLKRAAAQNLLEQARNLVGPSVEAQSQEEMQALLEIARAFSRYDVKRSFEIIDPLIEQFNSLSVAARTLNGFGNDYYFDDELDLQNNSPVAIVLTQMSSVLGTTAVVNFDRTKATADRISAPEARLKIYLDIAQQTIQAAR
jgi:hypothetical protein